MTTIALPIVYPAFIKIDIDPDTVEVHGHRFSARTVDGMSVSISLSERAAIPMIEVLETSKDKSTPPTIVGEAPPRVYGELLRGALGLPPTRIPKRRKKEAVSHSDLASVRLRVNGSELAARLSKTSHATDGARRVVAALRGLTRVPS